MIWLALILGGYLLGSIHFCRIFGILFKHVDICEKSYDKNPGAANAFWYASRPIGVAGLICDWAKGFIPVMLAYHFAGKGLIDTSHPLFILVVIAPVAGHAWSIFWRFRGGKCITTTIGVLSAIFVAGINYWLLPIFLLADGFFSFVKKILPGNLRALVIYSILIMTSIPICIYLDQFTILCAVIGISLIAIFKHLPIYDPRDENSKNRRRRLTRK